jgi:predicted hydrocarbon binding protein
MIDDDEAALVQQQQKEEEDWLKASVSSLHKNATLLENLVTCMQAQKDSWGYYVPALLTAFREVDEGEALLRFLIDSEVRNTPREATLFREDSVRIQGVQYYILTSVRDWVRDVVFKPILRKAIGGRSKGVELVALDVVRALNDNIATVPSALQQTLTKIGQSVGARFPSLAKTGNKSACVFLFLHVLTPVVVNPFGAGLTSEEIKDRETLLMLAKVGRTIQKWVNVTLGDEVDISASTSDQSLSSHSSDDTVPPAVKSPRVPGSGRQSNGEAEVLRFYDLVYKTDGVLSSQKRPEADECQDARVVLMGVVKKNYKLLRELEAGQDRQSTLNKHLGQQQGKIFASFTRQTTREDLRASAKFSACPESLNAESVRSEQSMVNSFSDFMRGASGNFMMNGDRYVFMPAAAWSALGTSRFMSDLPSFFSQLNHAQFFAMGLETLRKFAHDGHLNETRSVSVLAMFPYLALTGWGRFTLGVNSNLTRSNDFSLTVRTENSLETVGIDSKKSGTETRCHALCGFMAGWCTEAIGQSIQGVELQCAARGDKICQFLLAPEVVLESQIKRVAADLKSSYLPKPAILSFASVGGAGLSESPSRRGRSGEMAVSSPGDGVDAIKVCFMREATKSSMKEKRDRGASLTERFRSGSIKKTPEKRERVGTMGTLKPRTPSNDTPEVLGGVAALLAKKDTPVSSPDSGEVKIGEARYVAVRGKDFGSAFVLRCQNLLEVSATPYKRKSKLQVKVPMDQVMAMSKIAMGLLYGYGVCNGESFARQFLEGSANVPRNVGAYLEVFADALQTAGWGLLSHSSLSQWNEVSDDVWIVCHVDHTFESDDRLGNVWDLGSPTCMCMAGAIGGYCSQAFGVRCVCVELECAGCGTARESKRCSFLCTVPSAIVQRTKLYLAAIGKEDMLSDLVGGMKVTVFDEKEENATRDSSFATMIKQTL